MSVPCYGIYKQHSEINCVIYYYIVILATIVKKYTKIMLIGGEVDLYCLGVVYYNIGAPKNTARLGYAHVFIRSSVSHIIIHCFDNFRCLYGCLNRFNYRFN